MLTATVVTKSVHSVRFGSNVLTLVRAARAGARLHGLTYASFMNGLNKAGIELDRKVLSELAMNQPEHFAQIAEQAKKAVA